jgi:hypothetical protein
MRTRLIVVVLLALAASVAFAVDDSISFSSPVQVGNLNMEAGLYKIRVQGALVIFSEPRSGKSMSTVVKLEKMDKKSTFTSAQGNKVDGVQQVEVITLFGSDSKLVFPR